MFAFAKKSRAILCIVFRLSCAYYHWSWGKTRLNISFDMPLEIAGLTL